LLIKLDEDLSPMVGAPLAAAGHTVRTVVEQGWGGLKDPQLWPKVVAEGPLFLTGDKGFGDLRAYPPGSHPGIVLLRPDRESVVQFRRLVERLLAAHSLDLLQGSVTVVTFRSIRVRRAGR
jgi:predicted nuclease of predicted toxin-antitoxin system